MMKREIHTKYRYNERARTEILEVQKHLLLLNDLALILRKEYTREAKKIYDQIGVYNIRVKAWLILETLILGIGRLSDPARSMGHKNINFRAISETLLAADPSFELLAKNIGKCLSSENITIVRTHRNKRIAHFDYETYINNGTLPLLKFSTIRRALKDLTKLLDSISYEVSGAEIMYSNEDQISQEADNYLTALKTGLNGNITLKGR